MVRPPDVEARVGLESDADRLPASHGVLLMTFGGSPVQVLATSNLRQALASRAGGLGSGGESQEDASRGPPIDRARAWRAGSSFEADLLAADVARAEHPESHREMAGGLAVVWLSADPDSPASGWTIGESIGGGARAVGPFLDRASARRWSEMLDLEFELCRELAELRRAPGGTPCSYKEMGLCRATCEGAEPMGAYEGRLREAMAFTARAAAARRDELEEAMRAASAAGDFERASVLRDRVGALPEAGVAADDAVAPAVEFSFVAVADAGRAHHARLIGLGLGAWRVLGDVDGRSATEVDIAAVLDANSTREEAERDEAVTGVIARELIRGRRGGPAILRLADADPARVLGEVRRAVGAGEGCDDG